MDRKKPKPKRSFKPKKKDAQVKVEPEPEVIMSDNAPAVDKKRPKQSSTKKPRIKPQREIIQTKSVFTADGVDRRGYSGSSFGGGAGGGGGGGGGGRAGSRSLGDDLQARAPLVARETKFWTKDELKKEEDEAKKVLDQLYMEDRMIEHDSKLISDPTMIPVNVGYPSKEIENRRKELLESDEIDERFVEALRLGNSEEIFLLQVSDLPVVPDCADEDDYDPNEERWLGEVELTNPVIDFAQKPTSEVTIKVGNVNMKFISGTSSNCVQELVRLTAGSYQVVGDVTQKIILTPDVNSLLSSVPKI